jgi:hypothetical protein
MDWSTLAMLGGFVAFYAVGKGIGRAQGREAARRETPPHIALTLELEGDAIGGVHLSTVRPTIPPLSGPPPGHPDHDPDGA